MPLALQYDRIPFIRRRWRGNGWALLLLVLALASCKSDLKLPDIAAQSRIVLLGELVAQDSLYLRGGKSIPVASGSPMKYELPGQLTVRVYYPSGQQELLAAARDSWTPVLHTLALSSPRRIEPGAAYRLQAQLDGLTGTDCTVQIPKAFRATIRDTASVWVNGLSLLRMRIEIEDDPQAANFYAIEAIKEYQEVDGSFSWQDQRVQVSAYKALYDSLLRAGAAPAVSWDTTKTGRCGRIYVYTDDERAENLKISNIQSASRRILLSDKSINGTTYITQIYLDKSLFVSPDGSKGIITIRIKSLSEAYFTYLKGYEQFELTSDFKSLAQPVKVVGNIQNGLGVIGGVYQHQVQYLFDHWY